MFYIVVLFMSIVFTLRYGDMVDRVHEAREAFLKQLNNNNKND